MGPDRTFPSLDSHKGPGGSDRTLKRKQENRGTLRRWVCATCKQPTTLVTCSDGMQRCPNHKAQFEAER